MTRAAALILAVLLVAAREAQGQEPCVASVGKYCPIGSTTASGVPCPSGLYCAGGSALPLRVSCTTSLNGFGFNLTGLTRTNAPGWSYYVFPFTYYVNFCGGVCTAAAHCNIRSNDSRALSRTHKRRYAGPRALPGRHSEPGRRGVPASGRQPLQRRCLVLEYNQFGPYELRDVVRAEQHQPLRGRGVQRAGRRE